MRRSRNGSDCSVSLFVSTTAFLLFAGWTRLTLIREWEGYFRSHADGIDTGECSIRDFTRYVLSLLSRECTEEQGHVGNIEIGMI